MSVTAVEAAAQLILPRACAACNIWIVALGECFQYMVKAAVVVAGVGRVCVDY